MSLYDAYQAHSDATHSARIAARAAVDLGEMPGLPGSGPIQRRYLAALEMVARAELTHTRPPFAIREVAVPDGRAEVREEVALALPFGSLIRFAKSVDLHQPRVLVVAPLSGHFATLLRGTVETMLRDHEVYITDWHNARDVALEHGPFGFDDYVTYLIRFLEHMGPGAHVLAVCQPCVQTLAAVAVMAEDRHPAQPLSMTLMAGPIDTRVHPTEVNHLANEHPMSWFERNLIATVPSRYPGAGRRVYPGFIQLSAFMAMNPERHAKAHRSLYTHLARGELVEAAKIKTFYDEYFAVLDLAGEFYLETVDKVFQRTELAAGTLTYRGRPVRPALIRRTALLTVEGERDDICAVGQTAAAHDLCTGLRPHLKRHHHQVGVGHYGVFNGRKWETQIYPLVRNLMLSME